MANEYLTRTPTSSGNRSTHTWSGWIKRNVLGDWTRLFSTAGQTLLQLTGSSPPDQIRYLDQTGSNYDLRSTSLLRDVGSWMHIVLSVDHTLSVPRDRVRIYVNGAELDDYSTDSTSNGAQNLQTYFNSITEHALLGRETVNTGENFKGEAFDVFWVDGQALTPDVFGFYKDGDGYQSSGTTQATDFRPGQWSPRAPKSIKYTINRSGGFGVNGFYLPMNDSSNPGADFHCAPNSIIKLKGEDLPQPRNGAPTTSDAFVSELRDDPFAANLVLAVPGISTATGANLVTNGTFDTNTTGWTAENSAVVTLSSNRIRVTAGAPGNGLAYQQITTVAGQRYTISYDAYPQTENTTFGQFYIRDGSTSGSIIKSVNNSVGKTYSYTFIATSTSTFIVLYGSSTNTNGNYTEWDNIILKQEDAPRDYSADIKGSGTNKTLTAAGNAGVGYELGGYYKSAMTFDGSGDYFDTPESNNEYDLDGDYTIECWVNFNSINNVNDIIGTANNSAYLGSGKGGWIFGYANFSNIGFRFGYQSNSSWVFEYHTGITAVANQWYHVAISRSGSTQQIIINGVVVRTDTQTNTLTSTDNVLRVGGGFGSTSGLFNGQIQDLRIYKGVAKYKGGFDVPKPYTPVGIESWRTTADTCKNNFATWNAVDRGSLTLSDGNLSIENFSSYRATRATIGIPTTGKWYYEHRESTARLSNVIGHLGLGGNDLTLDGNAFGGSFSGFYWGSVGLQIAINGSQAGSGWTPSPGIGDGDILNIAYDADSRNIWLGINGIYYTISGVTLTGNGNPTSGTNPTGTVDIEYSNDGIFPYCNAYNTISQTNFGQNPAFSGTTTAGTNTDSNGKGLFKYAPPTGFLALCEDNLPTPAIADPGEHFKTVLYKNSQKISNVGFKPDLVWTKSRNQLYSHYLYDSVRGVGGIGLTSDEPDPEGTYDADGILSFDDDGFTLSTDAGLAETEAVAWCWKAGGAAVTNNDGTIESQISVNQTAGFSIVSYTGNNTNGASIGHGLGKKPNLIIVKERNGSSGWFVFQRDIGPAGFLQLHDTPPVTIDAGGGSPWFGTEPTDQVFTVGANGATNDDTRPIIAYCWAEIENYSKIGRFFGNGDPDGPFVYCGFKPAFIIFKNADATGNWVMCDSSRDSSNPVFGYQVAEGNPIEERGTALFDSLSNGFKIRNAWTSFNGDGNGIIFMAFAESPFQTANAK